MNRSCRSNSHLWHCTGRREGPFSTARTWQPEGNRGQAVKAILDTGTRGTTIFLSEIEVSDNFSYHRITERLRLDGTSGHLVMCEAPSLLQAELGVLLDLSVREKRTGLVGILYGPWIMSQVLRHFLCSYSQASDKWTPPDSGGSGWRTSGWGKMMIIRQKLVVFQAMSISLSLLPLDLH